jgi:putative ABC transport system permease protein
MLHQNPSVMPPQSKSGTPEMGARTESPLLAALTSLTELTQAQADMNIVSLRLSQQYPKTNKDWGANVMPLQDRGVVDFKPLFLLLSLVVAFVLLIACANVANMLLAQGVERQRELTIRMAVGASKMRLVG